MIEVSGLRKRFGDFQALDGLDLEVAEGTVLGLLGPNGAGKTTTVKILTTLLRPDSGDATVAGHSVTRAPGEVRRCIGLSGQYAAVDEKLTGFENLVMVARLYGMNRRTASRRATELLGEFHLEDAADRLAGIYSGGMRRKLDLAGALVNRPQVVVLDEPTTGLDPRARIDTWDVVSTLVAGGTTVLLTTQYLEEADRLADRIAVIDTGRVIAEGTPSELKNRAGAERIELAVAHPGDAEPAAQVLRSVLGPDARPEVEHATGRLAVAAPEGHTALVRALAALEQAGLRVTDAGLRRPTLDDVFLELTGHQAEPDEIEADRELEEVRP